MDIGDVAPAVQGQFGLGDLGGVEAREAGGIVRHGGRGAGAERIGDGGGGAQHVRPARLAADDLVGRLRHGVALLAVDQAAAGVGVEEELRGGIKRHG